MKNIIILFFLLAFILTFINSGYAVVVPKTFESQVEPVFVLRAEDIMNYNRKEIEAKIGRKFKFKERLALKIVKKKLKKGNEKSTKTKSHKQAITGFVFSLIGLLGFWFVIPIIFSILGLIFSFIALKKIKKQSEKNGKDLALAGVILGFVGIALFIPWIIILFGDGG